MADTRQRYAAAMCGRYDTFGPVSVSRHEREALELIELDIISEINQREPQYNVAPTQRAPVVVYGEGGGLSGRAGGGARG